MSGTEGQQIKVLATVADAELHVAFARTFETRGQLDSALAEYRKALRMHPGVASAVARGVRAIVDAQPDNLEARWLMGDALAAQGSLRQAMQAYLAVLNSRRSDISPAGDSDNTEE